MIKIQFSRDDHGYPNAKVEGPYEIFGLFLERDVQSPSTGKEILNLLQEVHDQHKSTGNAYELILRPKSARIESLFSETPEGVDISLEDFKQALKRWVDFLQKE